MVLCRARPLRRVGAGLSRKSVLCDKSARGLRALGPEPLPRSPGLSRVSESAPRHAATAGHETWCRSLGSPVEVVEC
jgi:hypothetical protein